MLGQVQLWASILGAQHQDALLARQVLGDVVLEGAPRDYGPDLADVVDDLRKDADVAWMWVEASVTTGDQPVLP
ncbi:MAG: hypothetical protein V9G19_22380 [Tetrasphaera sp.]